ncbi:non-ribosomal peptide synthetase (plasmid) [Salipiger sp. H15]|uniref:Non-ribosomal peptide synthetase n=1 Tax=Alloyangia sp. H15 TaxID=3029062 RepID=A0AAU8ASL9_9RHOB
MSFSIGNAQPIHSHLYYDPSFTIPRLFISQVRSRPNAIAVIEDEDYLSYAELGTLVLQLAYDLLSAGVCKGDLVGLASRRSVESVAAQLALVSIGAAFVPLDPAAAERHHREVVEQAGLRLVLLHPRDADSATRFVAAGCRVVTLSRARPAGARDEEEIAGELERVSAGTTPSQLAYVIFTSGSTGRPKGVMVAHRGVCRLVRGQSYADLGPDQVMLCMAAVGFDAVIGEVYSALLNGGVLAILPDAAPSLDRISEVISNAGVTIAYITAGLFHIIAEHRPEMLAPLRQCFPCGDVLSEVHVQRMRERLPHLRMINGYGPTENTVFTCCYPIDDGWTGGPIPIGRGLAHDELFVLDESLNPLADGEIGQLAAGGAGVGIGYLGQPELTEASFRTLTLGDYYGRVYLTGDLVCRHPDGVISFHGRADRQIKVNGQRVELDSIEHALRADAEVEDAVAVAVPRPDGTRRIVAIVKPLLDDGALDGLRGRLRELLPPAALPSELLARDEFPLTSSGKVDRRRMAADLVTVSEPVPAVVTGDSFREIIRQVWERTLGTPVRVLDKTFFDLGGTSLQLIEVHAELQTRLGLRFDIAKLFEAPRIRDIERLFAGAVTADPVAARRSTMARARARRIPQK